MHSSRINKMTFPDNEPVTLYVEGGFVVTGKVLAVKHGSVFLKEFSVSGQCRIEGVLEVSDSSIVAVTRTTATTQVLLKD